jgi:hypothetical protein
VNGRIRSAEIPVCGFMRLSSRQSMHRTGKSGKPAGWKACATIAAFLLLSVFQLFAQATDSAIRFRTVDLYVDTKDKSLAAYQLEFTAGGANAKIVGIEGGEHPAFSEAPFYDPKAMQQERVILAAFSTKPAAGLPKGKTRVATLHLQTRGTEELELTVKLQAAAGPNGETVKAETSVQERKAE